MKLFKIILVLGILFSVNPIITISQNNIAAIDSSYSDEEPLKEDSIQNGSEEIPLVFAKWWFWVGLILILLFIKYVIFKK